jgi:hypothetical protein
MGSPEDPLQQGACEGWAGIARPMSVARVIAAAFAAFAMPAQQSSQCMAQRLSLKQEATACRGAAHKASISMPATSLARYFIPKAILVSSLDKCHRSIPSDMLDSCASLASIGRIEADSCNTGDRIRHLF